MKAITRFDQHLRSLGIPIRGINSSGVNAQINFDPSATAPQIAQANSERATFDWTEVPDGDGSGFVTTVIDAVIADQIPTPAAVYLLLLKSVADDPVKRKALWTQIKADTNPSAALVTRIEAAAANRHMPLV